ncbi:MAG: fatty acyl-AMP ligase [Aestuariivirga sp.]
MTSKALKRQEVAEHELFRTPRSNRNLPLRLAEFHTLAEGLDYAAQGVTGFNFYSGRGSLQHVLPYALLRKQALVTARKLLSLGLKRGDRVAVVAETGPQFMTVFFACQYAGLIPCPMPYSVYMGGRQAYVDRVAGMLQAAKACAVITSDDLQAAIGEGAARAGIERVLTHDGLQALPEAVAKLEPFGPHENAYIQYSSGSTSSPKGVLITQAAILANTRCLLQGLRVTPEDRAFSWLPLYHDMGLVGFCLSPMMGQVTVDFLATAAFARRPALWLKLMSDNQSTVSSAPSFGYDLAARRINGEAVHLDLRKWRAAGIGGDMVRIDILNRFADKLSVAGFNAQAFLPSYGMAETTLAISISGVDRPVRVDTIERDALKTRGKAIPAAPSTTSRSFVACGKPVAGSKVSIRGERGIDLGEREVGRIFVNSPSLMAGYYHNTQATDAVVGPDGFLDTGDMGYWLDGEIVITGRVKDLILHNGRNIWPQDIEWAAEKVAPLGWGEVAAFAVEGDDGEDDVVVLVQCRRQKQDEIEALRREVSAAVHHSAGIECKVVMVPPKSLPFTSSGKLSRIAAKQKYLSGEIAELPASAFMQAAQ